MPAGGQCPVRSWLSRGLQVTEWKSLTSGAPSEGGAEEQGREGSRHRGTVLRSAGDPRERETCSVGKSSPLMGPRSETAARCPGLVSLRPNKNANVILKRENVLILVPLSPP